MGDPLRRKLRARGLRALASASALLPRPALQSGLVALAELARFTRYERLTRANLELALGAETSAAERARIARGVRRHTARLAAEWLRLARGAPPEGPGAARGRWIDETVRIDASVAILDRELARGRGAIVVTAHLGNWELLCAALRRRGHGGAVVGRERPRDPASRWLVEVRRGYGVETLPQHAPPRALLRVLEAGGVLGLLPDLEVRRLSGDFLPFFARPAFTMSAPAALARARRLPLLPCKCVAIDARRYELSFEEPLAPDPRLPREECKRELSLRLNQLFERWIRATPEQWAWHQRRWRTAPMEEEPGAVAIRGADFQP